MIKGKTPEMWVGGGRKTNERKCTGTKGRRGGDDMRVCCKTTNTISVQLGLHCWGVPPGRGVH